MIIVRLQSQLILLEDEYSLYLCSYCSKDTESKCIDSVKNGILTICSEIHNKYGRKFDKLNLYSVIRIIYEI